MHTIEFQLLLLIIVANGAPVLGTALLGPEGDWPLDGGLRLADGRRLLGPSKTWRGLLLSLTAGAVMAELLGLDVGLGLLVASFAMLGDVLSSFLKRRMGLPSSAMALGLDQIPECLLPLLAVRSLLGPDWISLLEIVTLFILLELALSRVLFHISVRDTPY